MILLRLARGGSGPYSGSGEGSHRQSSCCARRSHWAHINLNPGHCKHPNKRDVSPYWSRNFTYSGITGRTCRRCTRTHTPERCSREFSPRIAASMDLLNTLKVPWGSCESFGVNSTDSNLKCTYLEVPMDYHDSSAGTARLAVIKYSATAPNKRGTIFFNPGDPPRPSSAVSH